jgi:hypothetical protein
LSLGFRVRVSGFGVLAWGRGSGFGVRGAGVGVGFGFGVRGLGFSGFGSRYEVSSFQVKVRGFGFSGFGVGSRFRAPVSSFRV